TNGTATKAATCSSVYCHGNRLKNGDTGGTPNNTYRRPYWNYSAMINYTNKDQACGRCHGNPPSSVSVQHSGKTPTTSCNGCHANTVDAQGNIKKGGGLHINGKVEATSGHAYPYPGTTHKGDAAVTAPSWSGCTSSCHTIGVSTTYVKGTAPDCYACHRYNNVGGIKSTTGADSCNDCHGSTADSSGARPNGSIAAANFPNYSGSHTVHMNTAKIPTASCNLCHSGFGGGSVEHGFHGSTTASRTNFKKLAFTGVAAGVTWVKASTTCNNTCHGSGAVWGGRLRCIDCHDSTTLVRTKAGGYTMANVVAEFKTGGWSHTRTQGFTVTDEDCIVCHLEGSMATLSKTAKHGDGNVDLLDHGTATNDVAITDLGGAAITFKRFTTSFATGSRTSAVVNTAVRDVVTRKFCLGCHKSGGSSNTTAGQGGIAAGGTALKPFGSAGGTVLDINSQFATTNSSKHPVLGPLNRDYPTAALVANPYKPSGTRGTSGTQSLGVTINCFDCHNVVGTPLTHRTVSAHGNAVTIRGTIGVASPTLCAVCHLTYDTTNPGHPTGSAFTISDGHMGTTQMYLCVNCHASSISAAR